MSQAQAVLEAILKFTVLSSKLLLTKHSMLHLIKKQEPLLGLWKLVITYYCHIVGPHYLWRSLGQNPHGLQMGVGPIQHPWMLKCVGAEPVVNESSLYLHFYRSEVMWLQIT